LNHIGYHDIEECTRPPLARIRLALGVAGNDRAVAAVPAIDVTASAPPVGDGVAVIMAVHTVDPASA
jgi:hypothetical protein